MPVDNPVTSTVASHPAPFGSTREKSRELGHALRESPRETTLSLTLAIIGSVVGSALTSFAGGGRLGALAGAAIGPIIPLVFRPAPRGLRTLLIASLSLGAMLFTVTGVTAADLVRGRSVLGNKGGSLLPVTPGYSGYGAGGSPAGSYGPSSPSGSSGSGSPSGSTGSPDPSGSTTPAGQGPGIQAPSSLDCGAAATGGEAPCGEGIRVTSTGDATLKITSLDLAGDDFTATGCVGPLDSGSSCTIEVRFRPQGDGPRTATLLIHQNLPGPATEVTLTGTGQPGDTCADGYVWREAFDGDHICVTPDVRAQAADDNAAAGSRVDPNGAYGPNSCVQGYVWREATPDDLVCVTGDVRTATAEQNADPTAHRRYG